MGSKAKWSVEEQEFVKKCKQVQKMESWKEIAQKVTQKFAKNEKTGKQCRERYMNYIRFDKKESSLSQWTEDDDVNFTKLFLDNSFRWAIIGNSMPNKSQNALKNRFYGGLRKIIKIINQVQKNHKIGKTKPIRYESLIRVLQYTSKGTLNQEGAAQSFLEFHKKLKQNILQEAWKNLNGKTQNQEIRTLIENVHHFNTLTLFFTKSESRQKSKSQVLRGFQSKSNELHEEVLHEEKTQIDANSKKIAEQMGGNNADEVFGSFELPYYSGLSRRFTQSDEDLDLLLSRIQRTKYTDNRYRSFFFEQM